MNLIQQFKEQVNSSANKALITYPLLATTFCVLFTYFFWGFYYSEYEGLTTGLLSSSLTPGSHFRSLYFSGNYFISWFYSLFYQYSPNVQWNTWFEYLWLFIASAIAMSAFSFLLPARISKPVKIAGMIFIFMLVFADHHIHLIYTRVSYMLCGCALIGLMVFHSQSGSIRKNKPGFLLLNLLFIIGTFIRNEAAIACILLLIPFSLFYLLNLKRAFLLLIFPLIIVGGQSLFFALDIKYASDNEFYKQVEPDIEEQFIARGNMIPLSQMKTSRDSAIHRMGREMTFSDPKIMTAAKLRTLILPEAPFLTDMRQWNRAYNELKEIFTQYWYLVLIALLLSAALYVQTDFSLSKYILPLWLLFELSFWGLTIIQTYVDKVNERSWLPYIGLFILLHILLIVRNWRKDFALKLYPMVVIIPSLLCIHLYYLTKESRNLATNVERHRKEFAKIEALAGGKILVVNSSAINNILLHKTPFEPFDFKAFKKVYITDSYIIPFLPYYKQYMERECNCSVYEYPAIWNFIKMQEEDVIIVSKTKRLNVIKEYLKVIHQFELPLESISNNDERADWNAWKISNQ